MSTTVQPKWAVRWKEHVLINAELRWNENKRIFDESMQHATPTFLLSLGTTHSAATK